MWWLIGNFGIGRIVMNQLHNQALACTPRQLQAMELLANGHSPKQAAVKMGVRTRTVFRHINRAMSRLEAATRTQLIARAVAIGLIHVEMDADLKLYEISSNCPGKNYYTWAVNDERALFIARQWFDQIGYPKESPLLTKVLFDTTASK